MAVSRVQRAAGVAAVDERVCECGDCIHDLLELFGQVLCVGAESSPVCGVGSGAQGYEVLDCLGQRPDGYRNAAVASRAARAEAQLRVCVPVRTKMSA